MAAAAPLAAAPRRVGSKYDFAKSTEDNYRRATRNTTRSIALASLFTSERGILDPSYHGKYVKDRIMFQDGLVSEALASVSNLNLDGMLETPSRPIALFTAGPMGVGKSHVTTWLDDEGHLPLESFVRADPDHFRESFPEWDGYKTQDPETAGYRTNKEAGALVELTAEAAMNRGLNIWQDGSLKDVPFYTSVFERIHDKWPHYRIVLLYITASEDTVRDRASNRGRLTGRVVPEVELENSIRGSEQSFSKLSPLAHAALVINNDSSAGVPELGSVILDGVAHSAEEVGGFKGIFDLLFDADEEDVETNFSTPTLGRIEEVGPPQDQLMEESPSTGMLATQSASTDAMGEETSLISRLKHCDKCQSIITDFGTLCSRCRRLKPCAKCQSMFTGYGTVCSRCRRLGAQGSCIQCVQCNSFFRGFGDVCGDCA